MKTKSLAGKMIAATTLLFSGILVVPMFGATPTDQTLAPSADELVRELRQFQAALPPSIRSNGKPDPVEVRRKAIYDQLWTLGETAFPALSRGLADPDVQIRRNVALLLMAATLPSSAKYHFDLQPYLPALTAALTDSDARVKELAAMVIREAARKKEPNQSLQPTAPSGRG